jgi:hypothetical protein
METIVALAGRRIDPPDPKTERFPPRNIDRVKLAISLGLKKHGARWLVSSAAAGADLLGIKAAIDLGIACRIVLSSGVQEFARMSVEDRGSYWKRLFETTLSAVRQQNVVVVPAQPAIADSFKVVNERILNDAIALSVSNSAKLLCVAVWDGVSRGEDDFTAHFVERAIESSLEVVNITTL